MPRPLFILGPYNFGSGYFNLAAQVALSLMRTGKIDVRLDGRCNVIQEDAVRLGFRNFEAPSGLNDWKLWIYPLSQLHETGAVQDALTGESEYAKIAAGYRERGLPPAWVTCPQCRGRSVIEIPDPACHVCGNCGKISTGSKISLGTPISINRRMIIFSMWESTKLKPEWVEAMNKSAGVIVPSQWCLDNFKAAGVKVPVLKVPLGVDVSVFYPTQEWPQVCTFGLAGTLAGGGGFRKNLAMGIQAFRMAFPDQPDVRLRIKISPLCQLDVPIDDRIDVVREFTTDAQMADWYRSLTVFVSTSLGEGFGLQPLEAMACGRPAMMTEFSGVTEYFDDMVGFVVKHNLEPIPAEFAKFYSGEWGMPLLGSSNHSGSLIYWMQLVYSAKLRQSHKKYDVNEGKCVIRSREFTWDKMGDRLAWQLNKLMR